LSEYKAGGCFGNKDHKIEFSLLVYSFMEENIVCLYSPQLNVTGYGMDEAEAQESFEATLAEFFSYTTHKRTLLKELEGLGWKIRSKRRSHVYTPPIYENQISHSSQLVELLKSGKELKRFNHSVSVPSYA
jgi:hypothetical protein